MVFLANRLRRQAVASVRPDEHRGVRTKHQDLRTKTLRRDAMVFLAPLVPLLPLIAAHPAEHERNALLVGEFDNVLAGDFRFPAEKVDAEVLCVAQDVRFALRVVAIEKVGSVVAAADEEIAPVHLQVEIAALANVGEMFVVVAMLRDAADSEANMSDVRERLVPHKLQLQVVKRRRAHRVGPPEVRVCHGQFRKSLRRELDFAILAGGKIGD